MEHFNNAMKRQALGVLNELDHVRVGIVQNYRPFMCKVLLQPENTLTGWLPIQSAWIGNGWGMFATPAPGATVSVVPVEGSLEAAYVVLGRFDDDHRPLNVSQGEFWLVHESGASFKLTNDGKLAVSDGHGAAVTLNGDGSISSTGTWAHTGDFSATGNVSDGKRSMAGDRAIFNNHTQLVTGGIAQKPTAQE